MTITVVGAANANTVEFRCALGEGRGKWHGPLPAIGTEVDIEFSCDDTFVLDGNLFVSHANTASIAKAGQIMILTGKVTGVFENKAAAIDLAGSILLLELVDGFVAIGTWIELHCTSLELHDTGI